MIRLILFLLIFGPISTSLAKDIRIISPDGSLKCTAEISAAGISISATLDDKPIIERSVIEMSLGNRSITTGIKAGKISSVNRKETYAIYGLHSTAVNEYNGISCDIIHKDTRLTYSIEIRVFNDAVAYRQVIPGEDTQLRAPDESTILRFPAESMVWYHDLYMHYEGVHSKKLIDTVPSGQWAAPPLTIKLKSGYYLSVNEAGLTGYPGMALLSDGNRGFEVKLGHNHPASYPYTLRYTREDVERLSHIAEIKGKITTPWRVVTAGRDLNSIVNSDVLLNLCSSPDKTLFPEDLSDSWVRPGRAVWRYLDGGGDNTLRNMKEFSRKASQLGFEYNILEGFWSRWPEDSVRALVDYSKKLGVGIIVWKHSKDLRDPVMRSQFFKKLQGLGISGIKIDFFDHEAKEVIDLYESIFRECASLKLLLVLHGANKPTGLSRTYPNILVYEGIKGMEASKLSDRATHETVIPFTRMAAGPADYSVCHFGERRRNTTWTHQIATAAIYSAPLITYAANPDNLLSNPAVEIIKSIPPVWDETRVLPPSEIGECAVYAQRNGTKWFLSVINGIAGRIIRIPLSFLDSGEYKTIIISDDRKNAAAVVISEKSSQNTDVLEISLGEGGGYMARFEK